MRRYKNLFNSIIEFKNMSAAARKAIRGKKKKVSAMRFYFNFENEIFRLQRELQSGDYRPGDFYVFEIYEPKKRKINSSEFRDRVVHHAVCNILDRIFEKRYIYDTYVCRAGKGTHAALDRCQFFSKKYKYFLKCDIQKYFESIDHKILKKILNKIIKDPNVIKLLNQIIDHQVPGNLPEKSIPIGNLTSQQFANLYLSELDHFLKERLKVKGYLRYMDDFICFSNDKGELQNILKEIRMFITENLNLKLKEKVTKIAPVSEGIPFLGMRIFKNFRRLQRVNLVRSRRNIKNQEKKYRKGYISVEELVQSTNSIISYVSHANTLGLRRKEFEKSLDLA